MSIEESIEKYFAPKEKKPLGIPELVKMISEEMGLLKGKLLVEGEDSRAVKTEEGEKFLLSLPKFTPSEAWGNPNSEARKQIDLFIKQVPGPATLEGKIMYIQRLQEPDSRIRGARRIISTLVILESLSSVLNSFGDAPAGFVFEGFLAALLGGYQVDEPTTAGLPIEDIIAFKYHKKDPGVPMSLKLLKPKTPIKGSYTNLLVALNSYPQGMKYVLAKKGGETGEAIEITEFMITRENVIDMLLAGRQSINKPLMELSSQDRNKFGLPKKGDSVDILKSILQRNGWDAFFKVSQVTYGFNPNVRAQLTRGQEDLPEPESAEPEPEQLSEWVHYIPEPFKENLLTEGGTTDKGWLMTQGQMSGRSDILETRTIGVLDVSQQALLETASKYADSLSENIRILFQSVKDLSDNLNVFFVDKDRERGIGAGSAATDNAATIEETASSEVKLAKKEK